MIGEHSQLINEYIENGLSDVILGCAFFWWLSFYL